MNAKAFEAHLNSEITTPPGTYTRFKTRVETGPIIFSNFRCLACGRQSHMDEYTMKIEQTDTLDGEHFCGQICKDCVEKAYKAIKKKKGPQLIGSVN